LELAAPLPITPVVPPVVASASPRTPAASAVEELVRPTTPCTRFVAAVFEAVMMALFAVLTFALSERGTLRFAVTVGPVGLMISNVLFVFWMLWTPVPPPPLPALMMIVSPEEVIVAPP
jgi:hypothetical protein